MIRTKVVLLALVTSAVGCGDFGYADPNGGGLSSGSSSGGTDRGGEDDTSASSGTVGTASRLASDERGPSAVAVHGGTVYVANLLEGTIKRVSSSGGSLSLIDDSSEPIAIAAASQGVYWVGAGSSASLYRFQTGDSSPTEIAGGFSYAKQLLVTSDYVFVVGEDSLERVDTDGSSRRSLLSGELIGAVATDGSRLYWSDPQQGELRSSDLNGSSMRVIASDLDSPVGVAVDAASVYTVEHSSGTRIAKVAKSSSTGRVTYVTSIDDEITGLAADSGYVYWTTAEGVVARVSTSAGTLQTLAKSQQRPEGLTVASDGVYWVQTETGAVMRVKK